MFCGEISYPWPPFLLGGGGGVGRGLCFRDTSLKCFFAGWDVCIKYNGLYLYDSHPAILQCTADISNTKLIINLWGYDTDSAHKERTSTHTVSAEIVSLIQCYNCINEYSVGSSTHTRTTDFYNVTVSFRSCEKGHRFRDRLRDIGFIKGLYQILSNAKCLQRGLLSYIQNLWKIPHHTSRV